MKLKQTTIRAMEVGEFVFDDDMIVITNDADTDVAAFTDPTDADLFCLVPELIQLLRKHIQSGYFHSHELHRFHEIMEKFDPDFFKETNPLEILRV